MLSTPPPLAAPQLSENMTLLLNASEQVTQTRKRFAMCALIKQVRHGASAGAKGLAPPSRSPRSWGSGHTHRPASR